MLARESAPSGHRFDVRWFWLSPWLVCAVTALAGCLRGRPGPRRLGALRRRNGAPVSAGCAPRLPAGSCRHLMTRRGRSGTPRFRPRWSGCGGRRLGRRTGPWLRERRRALWRRGRCESRAETVVPWRTRRGCWPGPRAWWKTSPRRHRPGPSGRPPLVAGRYCWRWQRFRVVGGWSRRSSCAS